MNEVSIDARILRIKWPWWLILFYIFFSISCFIPRLHVLPNLFHNSHGVNTINYQWTYNNFWTIGILWWVCFIFLCLQGSSMSKWWKQLDILSNGFSKENICFRSSGFIASHFSENYSGKDKPKVFRPLACVDRYFFWGYNFVSYQKFRCSLF